MGIQVQSPYHSRGHTEDIGRDRDMCGGGGGLPTSPPPPSFLVLNDSYLDSSRITKLPLPFPTRLILFPFRVFIYHLQYNNHISIYFFTTSSSLLLSPSPFLPFLYFIYILLHFFFIHILLVFLLLFLLPPDLYL